jgi:hypothetical protein
MGWARVDRWAFAIWCVWMAAQIGWYFVSPPAFLTWWAGMPPGPDQLSDLMPPFGLLLEVPGWFILFKSMVGAPALMALLLVLLGDLWRAVRTGHARGEDST